MSAGITTVRGASGFTCSGVLAVPRAVCWNAMLSNRSSDLLPRLLLFVVTVKQFEAEFLRSTYASKTT
jgi:hypothetical protein